MKTTTIHEQLQYVTDSSFKLSLDDDKQLQFGVAFETINMHDMTGEDEFEQYPFIVEAQLIMDKPHASFNESGNRRPSRADLIGDCLSYMGGIPVSHILDNGIKGSTEQNQGVLTSNFDRIACHFSVHEATVITQTHQFGTIAAQQGKGAESKHLRFKTEQAAQKYIDYLIAHRVNALSLMIGFILDRPVNMVGDTGWSIVEKQVKGCK